MSHASLPTKFIRLAAKWTVICAALSLCAANAQTTRQYDFGAGATETGYTAVSNTTTWSAGLGYGWTNTTGLNLRDRGVAGALRRDFIFTNTSASNLFRVSGLTPDGKYLMTVLCGDASYGDHVTSVAVSGLATQTLSPRAGQYLQLTATVSANASGNLDITFGSPITNWVVNALTLEPTTTDITPVIVSAPYSEWDASVFATDPTQPLLASYNGSGAAGFSPSGLTRADYLALIASEVDFWKMKQNSSGAIIDPYTNSEIQYSTPAFANAAAALVVHAGRTDLLEPAAKAMDWASVRLKNRQAAGAHEDFYPTMLAHAYLMLEPLVTPSRAAAWQTNLTYDPYGIYRQAMGSMNWNVVSSCGEALFQMLGIRPATNGYVTESWAAQGRHFTSPYGLYMEGPMAYDHFPRIFFADVIAQGYNGPFSSEVSLAMDRAAITSLFMQSPWGELPAGGRSAHHQWNEAEQCFTYEIYAAKAKAAGNTLMAGAYKRAAHLALSSMRRWVRPSGEMQIVKNWVDPSARHGYEGYSYHSQYNLLPTAMLASAYSYAASTEDVTELPAPADTGGFVFRVDGMNKIFANAGGTYVELDTNANHSYDATGLIRIHRKGVPPQIGPSDSVISTSITTGVGVSWLNSSGTWHTLGQMNPTSVTFTPGTQTPNLVTFDVTYSGGLDGLSSITERYTVTPDGVQLTTEVAGYTGPLRYVWPVLSNDGKDDTAIAVSGTTVSVTQGNSAPQTFTALGAQSVSLSADTYKNHNGWARLATAEFPNGGAINLLVGDIVPTLQTSGTLHVDLRASAATGAGGTTWTNSGTLGSFARTGTPSLVTNVAGTGVPGVFFNGSGDAYTSLSNTVADLEGSSDRSIEVWAYNPAIAAEESLVSWSRRGSTRTNQSFNYGSNNLYGAATHWADDVPWGTVPAAGTWHYLTYVYSGGTDARVYVNGVLSMSKTLGAALATTAGNPINIGAQRSANNTLASGLFFSGYINSVRVHGGALSDSQIATNYAIGPAVAPTNAAPTLAVIVNQTLPFNTSSSPIALTVGDSDGSADALALSAAAADEQLIPASGLVLGGSGAERTLIITPAAGASGSTEVTITVNDGGDTVSRSFLVQVLNQAQTWRWQNFATDWENEALAGDTGDPDHDGLPNLLERALGSDPNTVSSMSAPQPGSVNGKLTITFNRSTAATDLTLRVVAANSPAGSWTEIARSTGGAPFTTNLDGTPSGATVVESGTGGLKSVRVSDVSPMSSSPARFLRLQVQP